MICGSWICGSEYEIRHQSDTTQWRVHSELGEHIKDNVDEHEVHGTQHAVTKVNPSNYNELIKQLTGDQKQFTDPEFPPHYSSIGNFGGNEKKI
jgi:hypothetical protein